MTTNYEWKNRHLMLDEVVRAVLCAVDPQEAVKGNLNLVDDDLAVGAKHYQLHRFDHVYLIGFGKAVVKMAVGAVKILGNFITGGLLIGKNIDMEDVEQLPDNIQILMGNHPVPGKDSFTSTMKLLDFLQKVLENDLIICLISGGGSALCTAPEMGIDPEDIQNMTRVLLACGAEINEVNVLRKHVDAIKGGGLAQRIAPAHLITLILSDVIGNPLDVIASGPTVPDESTFQQMAAIFAKHQLDEKMPQSILQRLAHGLAGQAADTPKEDNACFRNVQNLLVSSNYAACKAAITICQENGFQTQLLTTFLRGEAKDAGHFLASILAQIDQSGEPLKRPACMVLGGETTVTLQGTGIGGRNQEMALAAVRDLAGVKKVLLVTLATDGEDGPTDAAGAWVDGDTLAKGFALGMNPDIYLQNNDAYHYFATLDQLMMTGSTGTNVNDCAFLFAFD